MTSEQFEIITQLIKDYFQDDKMLMSLPRDAKPLFGEITGFASSMDLGPYFVTVDVDTWSITNVKVI